MQTSAYTTAFNWDLFIEKIRDEQCLLVLGPEVFCDAANCPLQVRLFEFLENPEYKHHHRHYKGDDFFLFDAPYKRTLTCHAIKSFYKGQVPGENLRQLAEVPFHVILTVTPDKLLHRTFDEAGFSYQAGYYKKNKDPQSVKAPTKLTPLLYSVFGCMESEESLVLTHDDLYDYFKSIFARKSMPQLLKDQLKEVKNILFLGVPFEKWYMQLLLRELEIHNLQYDFIRYAANQHLTDDMRTLCIEQFRINFIPGNNIFDFIQKMHEHCEAAGLIRKAGSPDRSLPDRVRQFISQGSIEEAINLLEDASENSNLQNDVTQLAGRYRMFQRRSLNNLLRPEEREVQEANILDVILQLAEQLSNSTL